MILKKKINKNILTNKTRIENLLHKGKYIKSPMVHIIYNLELSPTLEHKTFEVIYFISKKRIKLAVNRNYIKRIMRELVRLNKHYLNIDKNIILEIGIFYQLNEVKKYKAVEEYFNIVWHILINKVNEFIKKQSIHQNNL